MTACGLGSMERLPLSTIAQRKRTPVARETIDVLGSAAERTPGSGQQVRLYNRLVSWSKIILPAAVLAGIAALYLASQGGDPLEEIFSPEDLATLGAGLKLENPRFAGVTRDGEAFAVRADWAVPDSAMPRVIDLENPQGEFELDRWAPDHGHRDDWPVAPRGEGADVLG